MGDIIRELREDYPAVDVTTVVFSRDFAGVGCCVIPQDRVLAIISDVEALVKALEGALVVLESMPRPTTGLVSNAVQAAFDKRIAAIRQALARSADGGNDG